MLITILTALTGFFAPFIPEVLRFFTSKQDQKFELQRMRLQLEMADKAHALKIQELSLQADIAETAALHAPQQSFGVQMLDAAKSSNWGKWALVPGFYAFVLVDFLSALVRPAVTYTFVAFYLAFKVARLHLMASVSDGTFTWSEGFVNIWNDFDEQILVLVISFWFGTRSYKAQYGGSASTGKAGS